MNFLNRSANQPQRPTVVIKIRNATNFDVVIYMNAILCFRESGNLMDSISALWRTMME